MRSLLVALLLAPSVTVAQTGGGYDLTHNTIDGGGGRAVGGIYVIDATIGQADTGSAAGGSYVLRGGFWGGLVPGVTPVLTATPAPTLTATVSTPVTTAPPTTTATAPSTAIATATVLSTASATATDATRTPMASPTPSTTVTPGGCAGDCDNGGSVTVDEVITGVNIALGTLGLDQCPAFDTDASVTVTVDELIAAIDSALNGCR